MPTKRKKPELQTATRSAPSEPYPGEYPSRPAPLQGARPKAQYVNPTNSRDLYERISMGSRVTFTDRFGKSRTGKAVMLGPAGWVLNMGGRHGTPQVVGRDDVTRVSGGIGRRTMLDSRDVRTPAPPHESHIGGRRHAGDWGFIAQDAARKKHGNPVAPLPAYRYLASANRHLYQAGLKYYETQGDAIRAVESALARAGITVDLNGPGAPAFEHVGYDADSNYWPYEVSPGLWLKIDIHRMSSGRYELTAYVSKGKSDMKMENPRGRTLTFSEARKQVASLGGMVLKRTVDGEYRVNFLGGKEKTAYYTNDVHDAVATARRMVMGRGRRNPSGGYELFYGTGGHGGPYHDYASAVSSAARLLRGSRGERRINIKERSAQGMGGYGKTYGVVVKARDNEREDGTIYHYATDSHGHPDDSTKSIVGLSGMTRRGNPESEAAEVYEEFHGKPADRVDEYIVDEHYHKYLAELGDMISLKVNTLSNLSVEFTFESSPPKLASSEDRAQLYFVGGDQSIDLDGLKMSSDKWVKDSMIIGVITEITYETEKEFNKFEKIQYYHEPGEESGVQPLLQYDPRSKLMSITGGHYLVRPEGIVD